MGGGARTISLTSNGRWIFAACNSASHVSVVDANTMREVATLPIDSYPVGLDMSLDGKLLVVTSQGRKGHGGNAVTLVQVTYAQGEPVAAQQPQTARNEDKDDDNVDDETGANNDNEASHHHSHFEFMGVPVLPIGVIGCGIVVVIVVAIVIRPKERRNKK